MSAAGPTDMERWPWKHAGYRVFSRWVASDPSFFIVRRFGALNARVILCLQDEITELEEKLDQFDDEWRSRQKPNDTNNGSFRNDPCKERKELVKVTLREKLLKYNEFVNAYAQLASRPPVTPKHVSLVQTWFNDCRPAAIDDVEANYIQRGDDLIPVLPRNPPWFSRRLNSSLLLNTRFMQRLFSRKPTEFAIIQDDMTIWQDDRRIEALEYRVTAFVGLGMLIGPLWILAHVTDTQKRLGVITGFIIVFYLCGALATTVKPWESLAAAAAYSAVLMVFLQVQSK